MVVGHIKKGTLKTLLSLTIGFLTDQPGNGFVDAPKNLSHGLARFENLIKFRLIIQRHVADRFHFHFQPDKSRVHFAHPVHQDLDEFILKFIAGFRLEFLEQLLVQLQNLSIGFGKDISRAWGLCQK